MPKSLLIDAHNVLHTLPGLVSKYPNNRRSAMEELVLLTTQISERSGQLATLVFDGQPVSLTKHNARCRWQFSGAKTADEMIVALCSKAGAQTIWKVVTNDQKLKWQVQKLSISVVGVAAVFALEKKVRPTRKLSSQKTEPLVCSNEMTLMQLALNNRND